MDFDFLASNLQIAYPFKETKWVSLPGMLIRQLSSVAAHARLTTDDTRQADFQISQIDVRSPDNFVTISTAILRYSWSDGTSVTMTSANGLRTRGYIYGQWIVLELSFGPIADVPGLDDYPYRVDLQIILARSHFGVGPAWAVGFMDFMGAGIPTLEPSVLLQGPQRVRRVYLKRGSTLTPLAVDGQEVVLKPGFNMQLAAAGDAGSARKLTRVAINAVPGAGMGKYLVCDNNLFLRTLNSAKPNVIGNLNLKPLECYSLELPIATPPQPLPNPEHSVTQSAEVEPSQLRLKNSCGPCCSCEDYVKTYEHLRGIWDRGRAVSARFTTLRNLYVAVAARYDELTAVGDGLALAQRDTDQLVVLLSLTNEGSTLITATINVVFTFTLPGTTTKSWIANSGVVRGGLYGTQLMTPTTPDGVNPSLAFTEDLPAGSTVWWTGIWRINGIQADPTKEVTVQLAITGGIVDTRSKSLTFT